MNNCATGQNDGGECPALARSRSAESYRKTVSERLPAEPAALATTSNRKPLQEGHYISSMDGRAKRRKNQQPNTQTMIGSEPWQQHRAFGALDWASEKHSVSELKSSSLATPIMICLVPCLVLAPRSLRASSLKLCDDSERFSRDAQNLPDTD